MHRRELLVHSARLTGFTALLVACGADPPNAVGIIQTETSLIPLPPVPELEVDEWVFARPWKSLIDGELIAFGNSVLRSAPETVVKARTLLRELPKGATFIARDELFAKGCRDDSQAGDVVVVDGWMVPITLAGLAGALSQLKS
jgi:hypothetical protein